MGIYISLHDKRTRCLWISGIDDEQRVAGLDSAALVGLPAWTHVSPADQATVRQSFVDSLLDGKPRHYEVQSGGPAGLPYRITLFPVDFGPVSFVCVAARSPSVKAQVLTPRELEVLHLSVAGLSVKSIAKRLNLSTQRICNVRSAIRRKTGLSPTAWHSIST